MSAAKRPRRTRAILFAGASPSGRQQSHRNVRHGRGQRCGAVRCLAAAVWSGCPARHKMDRDVGDLRFCKPHQE